MIVILQNLPRQRLVFFLATALAACASAESHSQLQAVTPSGTSAWIPSYPVSLTGVLLTDPGEMLDSTANFQPASAGTMGGEWQIVIQSAWPGDRGGTVCWMGQNYALRRPPGDDSFSYSNEAWLAELDRVNHDPASGHAFRKGDLVTVTANGSLFFGGKRNLNEMHRNEPDYDFSISLVASNYGLPNPEVISLASLLRTNDHNPATSEDIFDSTRLSGGEYWQGMRIRINGLRLETTEGWNPAGAWADRRCLATDGEDRLIPLRLPRYSLGAAPTNLFDAIGILNQESGSGAQGTNGYELFVQEIAPSASPVLNASLSPVISWPGPLENYELQFKPAADEASSWQKATNQPGLVEGRWTVVIPPEESRTRIYRLHRTR